MKVSLLNIQSWPVKLCQQSGRVCTALQLCSVPECQTLNSTTSLCVATAVRHRRFNKPVCNTIIRIQDTPHSP